MSPQKVALLSPAHAAVLLESVIYEQVCELIDLAALSQLEERLALELGKLDAISDDEMMELSRAMIDRALIRIADDEDRYTEQRPGAGDVLVRYLNRKCQLPP